MFKKIRYIVALVLVAGVVLTAGGCRAVYELANTVQDAVQSALPEASQSASASADTTEDITEQERFDGYIAELPPSLLGAGDFMTYMYFVNPKAAGIEMDSPVISASNEEEWKQSSEENAQILEELNAFDASQLDGQSQLFREILIDAMQRYMLTDEFYYESAGYLTDSGMAAQLPLMLADVQFGDAQALEDYFSTLSNIPEAFQMYVEIEQERQTRGVGMNNASIEMAKEQFKKIIEEEKSFLASDVNAKIDALDFLDDTQKAQSKQKNEALIQEKLLPSYEMVYNELSKIEGRDKNYGLAATPTGKQYYEALLKQKTGTDMTPEEASSFLEERIGYYEEAAQQLLISDPKMAQKFFSGKTFEYKEHEGAQAILEFLQEEIRQDFPDIGDIPFEVKLAPESMRNPNVAAFYITRKLDEPLDGVRTVYVNSDGILTDYVVLAHEGFPGHLYQDMYVAHQKRPYALDIMTGIHTGYAEGWATYIEGQSLKYINDNKNLALLEHIDNLIVGMTLCYGDIGINYEGWSRDEFKQKMADRLSFTDEGADSVFDALANGPTDYLAYHVAGQLFQQMRDNAEETMGSSFSSIDYHDVLLKTGPSSFKILQEQVDQYVNNGGTTNEKAAVIGISSGWRQKQAA